MDLYSKYLLTSVPGPTDADLPWSQVYLPKLDANCMKIKDKLMDPGNQHNRITRLPNEKEGVPTQQSAFAAADMPDEDGYRNGDDVQSPSLPPDTRGQAKHVSKERNNDHQIKTIFSHDYILAPLVG